jgi:Tfp pilus assembly protein PilX
MEDMLMNVRLRRSDDGFTMVMAVIITAIVFSLGGTWLAYADHESSLSAHDRRRQHAIDAANAGLVVADAALARNKDYTGTIAATEFTGG